MSRRRRSPSPAQSQNPSLRADLVAWYTHRDEAALSRVLACLGHEWARRLSRVRNGDVEDIVANFVLKKLIDCSGTPLLPARPDVSLMAHIRTVVSNACIDAHRHAVREDRKGTPMEADDLQYRIDCVAVDGWDALSTARIVEAREVLHDTFAALHQIPALRRMALIMARELYTVPGFRSELVEHARAFARVRGERPDAVLARIDEAIETMSTTDELRVLYPFHYDGHPETARTVDAFTRAAHRAGIDLQRLVRLAS
jgi:DNA-directed RNA polymerase specialized sigma24 family protein